MTNALDGLQVGPYLIVRKIASGGMATVYLAEDTTTGGPVAFKLIRPDLASPELADMLRARFLREVQVLQRLEHPYIVRIHAAGEYEGYPYLVMEYLPGGTLRDRIRPGLSYRHAAAYLLPVTEALVHAHAQGILHRDIKPANILFDADGNPRLTDFGIAKDVYSQEMTALTATGVGIGTPDYMSPEQSLGQTVDGRSDIYSLGVVLYELVSGKKPFSGTTPAAVLVKHINEPFTDPRIHTPDLPDAVVRVLEKAMAKQPAARYADMATFSNVLQRLADGDLQWALALTGLPGGLQVEATITPATPPPMPPAYYRPRPPATPSSTQEPVYPPHVKARHSPGPPRWLWALIGLGGVIALAFLGFVLWNFGSGLSGDRAATQTLEALVTQLSAGETATAEAALNGASTPCDRAAFVMDVTLPDDIEVAAGSVQQKIWRVRNTGSCTWTSDYVLVLVENAGLGVPEVQGLPGDVPPGSDIDLSVDLTMPETPGTYQADYQLRSGSGTLFGPGGDEGTLFVRVVVVAGTPATTQPAVETPMEQVTPSETPEPSSTPTPTLTPVPPSPTPGLAFTTPAAPVADRPVLTGMLAFVEGSSGSWRITLGDVRTWALASLPGLPADSGVPAWSPDGRSLLFRSSQSGRWQVHRINLDGSGLVQLTTEGNNYEGAWSPDGQRIVFVSERDSDKEIYIMNADGTSQVRLTDHAGWDDDPSWSPDGQWIIFESKRDNHIDVYRMRADGSEVSRLTSGGDMNTTPAWSPDGQWIAFERKVGSQTDIWVMDVNGDVVRQVSSIGTENYRPAWSPDSQWLAITSNHSGLYAIWVINISGQGAYQFSPAYGVDAAWTRP